MEDWACGAVSGLTAGVLAIATYFHHVRLFGLFTILAAILAIFLDRTIARGMRAFVFCVLSHKASLLSSWFVLEAYPKTRNFTGQGTKSFSRSTEPRAIQSFAGRLPISPP